jgi:shikimate kinase
LSHIVLVGLPGSGKTTVGRAAAKLAGKPFLDFDEEIVSRQGMSVAEFFAARGEPAFRALERQLTEELVGRPNAVVSPGGGWIATPGVVEIIRPPARLIYLRVSPETALKRLGADTDTRPLLAGRNPLADLSGLLARRREFYEDADAVIDTELVDIQEVIRMVADEAGPR